MAASSSSSFATLDIFLRDWSDSDERVKSLFNGLSTVPSKVIVLCRIEQIPGNCTRRYFYDTYYDFNHLLLQRQCWLRRRTEQLEDGTIQVEFTFTAVLDLEDGSIRKEISGEREIIKFFKRLFGVPDAVEISSLTQWFSGKLMTYKVARYYCKEQHYYIDVCGEVNFPEVHVIGSYKNTDSLLYETQLYAKERVMLGLLNPGAYPLISSKSVYELPHIWVTIVKDHQIIDIYLRLREDRRALMKPKEQIVWMPNDDGEYDGIVNENKERCGCSIH